MSKGIFCLRKIISKLSLTVNFIYSNIKYRNNIFFHVIIVTGERLISYILKTRARKTATD